MIVWGFWETEKDATSEQIEWDAAPSGQDPQDLITTILLTSRGGVVEARFAHAGGRPGACGAASRPLSRVLASRAGVCQTPVARRPAEGRHPARSLGGCALRAPAGRELAGGPAHPVPDGDARAPSSALRRAPGRLGPRLGASARRTGSRLVPHGRSPAGRSRQGPGYQLIPPRSRPRSCSRILRARPTCGVSSWLRCSRKRSSCCTVCSASASLGSP